MLTISEGQMESLRLQPFERDMLTHIAAFSPPFFKAVGEAQMRKAIHLGVQRAREHGFTLRGPVRLYLELMMLFGSHFDSDPQYPWAAEVLAGNDTRFSEMQRAKQLHARALEYRQAVAGPDDGFVYAAQARLFTIAKAPVIDFPLPESVSVLLRAIDYIYPEKARHVGEKNLAALIQKGIEAARRRELASARGVAVIVGLMLILGHRCEDDPLYPWIRETLGEHAGVEPSVRAKSLESTALVWLQQFQRQ